MDSTPPAANPIESKEATQPPHMAQERTDENAQFAPETDQPTFPPPGHMIGHIFSFAPRYNPDKFTIKTATASYEFHGKPPAGQFFRRLCPVIFLPDHLTALSVREIESVPDSLLVPPIKGKLISITKGVGTLSPIRFDGTYDNKPIRFFTTSFTNPNIPTPNSPILFRTGITHSNRKDKNGHTAASQRYVDIIDIQLDHHALQVQDEHIIHPTLLKLLGTELKNRR
jgi:hypothetical protein